jgi:hypothetical protein
LRTARFTPAADPREKALALIELAKDLRADARSARWIEALAVARDGRVLASWTERGPRCFVALSPPQSASRFWVDGLLERCEDAPGHWDRLVDRFSEFCRT